MTDYYSVLRCPRFSSYEALKKRYQELARIHHPDKRESGASATQFHLIDKAWKTLRDPLKKEAYDLQLKQQLYETPPVYASVTLSELTYDQDSKSYSYPCRCGSLYMLSMCDVNSGECFIACEECSFCLHCKKQ